MTSTNKDTMIEADGELWVVLGYGAKCNGAVFVHLAHPTRGARQRNGWRAAQVCGWLRDGVLHEAP